jgi:peroxiredoxin Q/BCP
MLMKTGDKIPSFSLPDENGEPVHIDELADRHILVLYFYPKDDTPGCTREACTFRDDYQAFVEAGAKVIGISNDSVKAHKDFKEKYALPFTLLSDEKNEVRKLFKVPSSFLGLIPGRVTYIIDEHRVVRKVFKSQVKPARHVEEALDAIRKIKDERN